MIRVIGLGAGGHAKVVIDILRLNDGYEVVGLLDLKQALWNTETLGVPVLGNDSLLPGLYDQGLTHAFIGLGTTGDTRPRIQLYEKVRANKFDVIHAIHPTSIISSTVKIGAGSTIAAGAIINADVRLGQNVIINTGAIIEHDCVIGDHVHVASGARLASTVYVDEGTHIGLGASVRQCARIGRYSIVGAGAVVVNDVPNEVVVVGVPARVLRRTKH